MKPATEKFNKSYIEIVKVLKKSFSEIEAGQRMLISSPKSIANFIKNIPFGSEYNIKKMRTKEGLMN